MFLGKAISHSTSGAIALKGFELVRWNLEVLYDIEDLVGIDGKLREHVLRLGIFVNATEPVPWADMHNAGNRANFLAVERRKPEDQRDFVPANQTKVRCLGTLIEIKTAVDAHQQRQQQKREADADSGEETSAAVAECVLGGKARKRHIVPSIYAAIERCTCKNLANSLLCHHLNY